MKTKSVIDTEILEIIGEEFNKPLIPLPMERKTNFNKKSGNSLVISNQALENWIAPLNKSNGIYFLDLPSTDKYNIHFKDHETGKLMEINFQRDSLKTEEPDKEFLEKLLFDLSLFQDTEPIVVFNKLSAINFLTGMTEKYFEFKDEVESIVERLVDMEQVFKEKWYYDSGFRDINPESIYQVLYPERSNRFSDSTTNAMYQIFMAIQSIHLQVAGINKAA